MGGWWGVSGGVSRCSGQEWVGEPAKMGAEQEVPETPVALPLEITCIVIIKRKRERERERE